MSVVTERFVVQESLPHAGNTWLGVDRLTQKEVFIKARDRGESLEALFREFRVAGSIWAPGIVRALDLVPKVSGEAAIDHPGPFLILEHVLGSPWPRGPLPPSRVGALLTTLLDTLIHLHLHGWLHLDLKPENVLVDGEKLTLVDLGHARRPGDMASLTGVWGTRGFVPPEVLRHIDGCPLPGDELSWSCDLYQVGLLAVFALTGCAAPVDSHHAERWWEEPVGDLLADEADAWMGLLDGLLAPLCAHRFASATRARHALGRIITERAAYPALRIPLPQRFLRDLLKLIQAGLRERAPTFIHLHGPPGSGRSRLLEQAAQRLRLIDGGVPLAWIRTNPLHLIGDTTAGHHPQVLFLQNAARQTDWAELDALFSGHAERPLVLITCGERPSPNIFRSWQGVDLVNPSLSPRDCVCLVRSLGREPHPASLRGGHPALLQSADDDSVDAVAAWLTRQATDPRALARAAAERVFLGRISRDGLDGIPLAWRRLSSEPRVLEALACTLPRGALLALDERSASQELVGSHQDPLLVAAHARLGRTETAARRFKRQIACCRRQSQSGHELSWILEGLRCSCLKPAWWLRASKLLVDSSGTAHSRALLVEALNAFPPWSLAACIVHDRLLGCEVQQHGTSALNQRFLRLATICEEVGAMELATRIRVRSLPWDSRVPEDLPECLEIVRRVSRINPPDRTCRQELYIELAEIWADSQQAVGVLLGAAERRTAAPPPHAMLQATGSRALATHKAIRSSANQEGGSTALELAMFCAEASAEKTRWAALARYNYRWAQQARTPPAHLFSAASNLCSRTPPHPYRWASWVLARTAELARERERSGVLREATGLYFHAGTFALVCARVREAAVYLSRAASNSFPARTIAVAFNLSTAAAYTSNVGLAQHSLERFLFLSARAGHDAENAPDTRLLRAIVHLTEGHYERSAELCRLALRNATEHAPEDLWEAWRTLIECEMDAGSETLAETLAQPPEAEVDTGSVTRLLACLSSCLGHARFGELRRDLPEMQELLRWSERLPFAWGAYAATMAALLHQKGKADQAQIWRDRANERFRLLGWGHPVRTD